MKYEVVKVIEVVEFKNSAGETMPFGKEVLIVAIEDDNEDQKEV